jgi:hypothetical protein
VTREIREQETQRSSSLGLRIPHTPACNSVGAQIPREPRDSCYEQQANIFNGWCLYGYWQDGVLTRGKPSNVARFHAKPIPQLTAEEQRKEERKSWRRNASRAVYKPASKDFSEWLAHIPTLDEWRRQER